MRMILHAGTHKTGTTSIQKVLADNRKWLRKRGVYYPDGGTTFRTGFPHHKFAHGMTRVDPERLRASLDFIKEIRKNARDGESVIISSEPIYRHVSGFKATARQSDSEYWVRRRCYLEDLACVLREFDIEVLLFFRRVDDFAASLYSETIRKRDYAGTFTNFVQGRSRRFEYDAQFALFRSIFPKVTTLSYDHAREKGVVPTFFETVGCAMPPDVTGGWVRQSPHPRLLLWMDRRKERENWEKLRDFITSDEAGHIFSDKVGFWPSATFRDEFLKRYRAKPACQSTLPEARLSDEEAQVIDSRFEAWAAKHREETERIVQSKFRWLPLPRVIRVRAQ